MTVFLDEIEVGAEYVSDSRTVHQTDIARFAELSGDFNPLHVDPDWVQNNTDYNQCIAHGLLMLAIGSGLRCPGLDDWHVLAYLAVDRCMVAPTYPGDTVRAKSVVTDVRPSASRPGSGIVKVEVALVNQDGDTLQSGTDTYLVGARP
jgi:acyl dehydratase